MEDNKNLEKGVQELAQPGSEEKVRRILNEPGQKVDGVSNTFTQALAAILPTVVGSIFGGSAGTAIGANVGLQAMDTLGKQQMRQQELALDADRFNKEQLIRAAMEDEKLRRIGSEPLTMWQKAQLANDAASRALREKELNIRGGTLELGQKKFANVVEQQSDLSDKQVETVNAYDNTLNGINRITELKKGQSTGPFQEFKQNALAKVGMNDPKFAKFKAATTSELASYLNQISGTAASEKEVARLREVVPNTSDSDDVFAAKLEEFKRRIEENKSLFLSGAAKYQGKQVPGVNRENAKSEKVAALRALLGKK